MKKLLNKIFKRSFDIIFSIIWLIILLPFLFIISIVILIDSKGPIFFLQKRIGINSKPFVLFKFRTMKVDSHLRSQLTIGNRDNRITKFGYYLRKYKIDEIPQLLNILIGDMSIVGPRPEVEKYVNYYPETAKKVLSFQPGLTDPASLIFRNENEILETKNDPEEYYIKILLPFKLKVSLEYLENQSFFNDLVIILQTFFSVLPKPFNKISIINIVSTKYSNKFIEN